MSKNKKSFSALLVCLFSLQVLVPFCFFTILYFQKEFQKEFISAHSFEKNYFEKFVLDEKDFNACKTNEGEIVINNNFFDIRSVEKKDGRYIVYVLADNKETSLQKIIKKEPIPASGNKLLVFSLLFYEDCRVRLMEYFIPDQEHSFFNAKDNSSIQTKVPTPPPDKC